jgi:carbonic anhydrase/acetyltransferase-like protein (isoleucine patch superfamily)
VSGDIVVGDRVVRAGGEIADVAMVGVEGATVLRACVVGDMVVEDKVCWVKMILGGAGLAGLVLREPVC